MKVKIAKRVVLLCVALTIAFVVTFGRRDGQPQIDGTSDESATENLSLRLAGGSDDQKNDLPPLTDVPVFGPTNDPDDQTNNAMAALPGLPSLDGLAPPEASDSAPEASTSPVPDSLDALPLPSLNTPTLDPLETNTPTTDNTSPGLNLPPLTDSNSNAPTESPLPDTGDSLAGLPPALNPLPSVEAKPETDNQNEDSLRAFSANQTNNKPLEPFPAPFTPPPAAATTLPNQPAPHQPLNEPVATVAQLPPTLTSNAATSPIAPAPTLTPLPTTTPTQNAPQPLPLAKPTPFASAPATTPTLIQANPPVSTAPAPIRPRQPVASSATRRHRVTVTDSLESISQQYFGSPAYAGEIYQANRDRLERPDILMLNTQLVIPQLAARDTRQNRFAPGPTLQQVQQTARQPAIDPFNALPTGLPSTQPSARPAPNADNFRAIPETRKPVNPLPGIIQDTPQQDRKPQTRLVPVPSA